MNRLEQIENQGLVVDWAVVRLGWMGPIGGPPLLSDQDIRDNACKKLANCDRETLSLISDLCVSSDPRVVSDVLERISPAITKYALRVWVVVLLGDLLEVLPQADATAGMTRISSFWVSAGCPTDSPHIFQGVGNSIKPDEYYSDAFFRKVLLLHRQWLSEELNDLRECAPMDATGGTDGR